MHLKYSGFKNGCHQLVIKVTFFNQKIRFFNLLQIVTCKNENNNRIPRFFSNFYMCISSSRSKMSFQTLATPHRSLSISISSTKLERALQPTLESFDHILFININFLKLSNCKQHFLRLVKISIEFFVAIFICDPTMHRMC